MTDKKAVAEQLVPLFVANFMGGTIKGRTRLQKLVFLSQRAGRSELGIDYEFGKGWYGPFSNKLGRVVDDLVSMGLLTEKLSSTSSGHRVIEYGLTRQGRSILQTAGKSFLTGRTRMRIQAVCKDYGSMPFMTLLERVHNEYPEYVLKNPWKLK
jgi:uncharacterized protein YwgA